MRAACLAMVSAVWLSAQGPDGTPLSVARTIEQELTAARVPGAAIAVVWGDRHHAGAVGFADAARQVAMTPATLVQAGSVTKLFTALATTAALDARGIALDSGIGAHLPGLSPPVGALTFHQLLAQTSGLGDRAGGSGTDDEAALAANARRLSRDDFVVPPGTVFSYSNSGYALAGAAVEAVVGKPFADALRDGVLAPLGMTASTMRPAEALARPHAVGHRVQGERVVAAGAPANDTRLWPSGYLWTSADDMARALAAMLGRGPLAGHAGLPPRVIARVTTPHVELPNVFVGGHYGYGLMIARDQGVLFYEHGGTMPGFSAIVRFAPEQGLGIAILTNLENAPLRRIAQTTVAQALGLASTPSAARTETAVSPADLQPLLGIYRNRGTAELAVRDGRVVLLLDGGPPLLVSRLSSTRFLARPKPGAPGPEFVLQPATSTTPAYLHFALWAYGR